MGTTADGEGNYKFDFDVVGSYQVIFSALGYTTDKRTVIVGEEDVTLDVKLRASATALREITVRAKGRDPAYGIIRKVVDNKAKHLKAADSYRTHIYLKAVEEIDRKEKKQKKAAVEVEAGEWDPFAEAEKAQNELLGRINLLEMEVILNFQQPRSYKEERIGLEKYGNTRGLFVPNFGQTDFNFYRNLVALTGISDAPVISPFSQTGVLSYKFELIATDLEGSQIVYEIKVTPRKEGNSTAEGTVWVNADSWTINRVDLRLSKYALKFFDAFQLQQTYGEAEPGLWTVSKQRFVYTAKQGKRLSFNGTTTLAYSDYEHNYAFPEKFFGNEIAVTTKAAYERDSSYWEDTRVVALTREEAEVIHLRDSIEAVVNSAAYQDSLQAQYNKIKLLEILADGVGFRNNTKKQHVYIGSLLSLVDFSPVGGFRIGPYLDYRRRYPDGTRLNTSGAVNVGIENQDVQGNFSAFYQYAPFKFGSVSVSGGRSFESINPYDAFINQLSPANFILADVARGQHSIEIFNGFTVRNQLAFTQRSSVADLETETFLEDLLDPNDVPLEFQPYEALILTSAISYTPGQKYLREPDRKILLGSRWPTFSLEHRKGLNGPLGSDINFDFLQFSVTQDVIIGALGTSRYEARVGKFVNDADLRLVDIKRFRQSDPLLLSNPTNSFQILDTAITTANTFLEFHHIHHFNGALINNIPLLKKTRIKALAGGGLLYLPEDNFRYQEIFVGLERVFKIGARRRLRVGVYGVVADASEAKPASAVKVGFDLIDLWKRDWSF